MDSSASQTLIVPRDTLAKGIFATDYVLQSAIVSMLNDLRLKPWLLDMCFNYILQDVNLAERQSKFEAAKNFFIKNKLPVFVVPYLGDAKLPCITIAIAQSNETANTLGDTNGEGEEEVMQVTSPDLSPRFAALSYTQATGLFQVPTTISDNLYIIPGMKVVDDQGLEHEIISPPNVPTSDNSFYLATGLTATFNNAIIRGYTNKSKVVDLKSAAWTEVYRIGVHVNGEPSEIFNVHAIMRFALLRYRRSHLEARGIELTSLSSAEAREEAGQFQGVETYLSQYITMPGTVRHYWPDAEHDRAEYVTTQVTISPVGSDTPQYPLFEGDVDPLTGRPI